MGKLRIPLQIDVKNRNDLSVKDASITNGFVEQTTSNKLYTVKRPGLGFVSQGAGTANGIFVYNDTLYTWDTTTSNTSPRRLTYIPGYGFGIMWSGSTVYKQNDTALAIDPADGIVKPFYARGDMPTVGGILAAPSTTPQSAGLISWSPTPITNIVYGSSEAARDAAIAYMVYVVDNGPHPLWNNFIGSPGWTTSNDTTISLSTSITDPPYFNARVWWVLVRTSYYNGTTQGPEVVNYTVPFYY